jgi:hypothetical protein
VTTLIAKTALGIRQNAILASVSSISHQSGPLRWAAIKANLIINQRQMSFVPDEEGDRINCMEDNSSAISTMKIPVTIWGTLVKHLVMYRAAIDTNPNAPFVSR